MKRIRTFALPMLVAIVALATGGCGVRRALAIQAQRQDRGSGETLQIAGLKVSVWRPAQIGRAPLVIFSHGFHGSSTQSVFLMKALADDGYLVVAPNHRDAGFGSGRPQRGFGDAGNWTEATYNDRAQDIKNLIGALKKDPNWKGKIDWSKVALAGHSLGGYTVLGLAGAWPSWKLPEVKAILALSPYCTPFTQKKTLGGIRIPVMYQGGTRDFGITPSVQRPGGAYDQTPAPAYFVDFQGAGHLAWTDLNPEFQSSIDSYAIAFLDKYVKADSSADPTKKLPNLAELKSK